MTIEADNVLKDADVIVGYETYLSLVKDTYPNAEYISTPMRKERERCVLAYEAAKTGKSVAMICSGDAGIYGMASLMYEELLKRAGEGYELRVVAGVTAAISGAALLGAPIGHDFCVISLSDLLTPWEVIVKRLRAAAEADFVIVLYNPSSHKRADYLMKVAEILNDYIEPDRICGIANLIGREGQNSKLCKLCELKDAGADMFSTVFIGSSTTEMIDGKMVTPRGYNG
ncbi:MAG: precorrin-3B C(17)-methyltransferase [Lachnospiraceae bacterium]|nr:precorrin-3B C(17)-methyltransferase [Lachnospiraceae bacterium]